MPYAYHLHRSHENSQYFWNLKAGNHQGVAWSGETYVQKVSCRAGLDLFRANAANAPINDLTLSGAKPRVYAHEFEVFIDTKGEHRWRFQAANNQIVGASGEGFSSKQKCLESIALVKANAQAPIQDHTLAAQTV